MKKRLSLLIIMLLLIATSCGNSESKYKEEDLYGKWKTEKIVYMDNVLNTKDFGASEEMEFTKDMFKEDRKLISFKDFESNKNKEYAGIENKNKILDKEYFANLGKKLDKKIDNLDNSFILIDEVDQAGNIILLDKGDYMFINIIQDGESTGVLLKKIR